MQSAMRQHPETDWQVVYSNCQYYTTKFTNTIAQFNKSWLSRRSWLIWLKPASQRIASSSPL